jgi:hypothetical protein
VDAKDERPNFFLLLDLDPEAVWDDGAFEQALGRCRTRWTTESGGIASNRKTREAKENIRTIRALQATMRDPAAREQERRAALQAQAARLQHRRHEVTRMLDIRLAKGYLYDVEESDLRATAGDVLAIDPGLEHRLATADIRPMRPVAAPTAERLAAEPSLLAGLETLREKSLYDVLSHYDRSITQMSPRDRLLDAADKLYLDGNRSSRKDAVVEAKQTLGGIAKSAFATDGERRKHDNSMRLRVLDELISTYESALAAVPVLYASQVHLFLADALASGIDVDEARDHLLAYFTGRKWRVDLPGEEDRQALLDMVVCPCCAARNERAIASCAVCGLLLWEPCPACGETVPTAAGCGRCGFPTGQRGWVLTLVEDAQRAVDDLDAARAGRLLDSAEEIWRLPPGRTDPLTERIGVARSRLEATTTASNELTAKVRLTMAAGRHQEALRHLEASSDGGPDRAGLLTQARRHVTEADELCRRSRASGTTVADRVQLLREALRVCADHTGTLDELARIPPRPPARLDVEVDESVPSITLTWTPAAERDVRYIVVRSTSGRAPTTVERGRHQQPMETVGRTRWEDRAPVIGTPLRYAVFTERAGTVSTAPAAAAPVFVTAEPTVRAEPRDGGVELEWTLPVNAQSVDVSRDRVDGTEPACPLTTNGSVRLLDRGLRNGVRYRYTLRAVYRDPTVPGGVRRSVGRPVDVTPHRVPEPPGPVDVRGARPVEGSIALYRHRTTLRWPSPAAGTMRVVRPDRPGDLRPGDQIRAVDLRRYGYVFDGVPPMHDPWLDSRSYCQYVPALVVEGIAYVGHPRPYAAIDEVGDLRLVLAGSVLRLHWTWPAESDSAVVAPGTSGDSAALLDAGSARTVVRDQGSPCGLLTLGAGMDAPFVVAAGVMHDGVRYLTTGREVLNAYTSGVEEPGDAHTVDVAIPRGSVQHPTTDGTAAQETRRRRIFGKRTGST